MAYRFRMDEPVEAGLRRIAREQIDEALAAIAAGDEQPERTVHEVRQRCKALRALIRLVRPGFAGFQQENRAFRDVARALAGLRDSKVLVDTLDDISDAPANDAKRRLFTRLRKRFARPSANMVDVRETLTRCAAQLREARERVTGWTLDAEGWGALSQGFGNTARSTRRAMASLVETGDAECSHDWRKHAKYHWHHMRLLRAARPRAADKRIARAERLSALLGTRHDLDLLVEALAAQPRRAADAPALDLLIAKARKRAASRERKARQIGARLFDERPRKLAAKWGERWREHVAEDSRV